MAGRWLSRWWLSHSWLARWWRRRSLRARLTLITSAGLALALAAAAVLLVNALRLSLIRGLDDSARQGAVEVAALIDQDRLPDPVPVGSGTITIQVLDAQGRITDVSPGADRLVPLLTPAQAQAAARTGQGRMLAGPPRGIPSLLRVVAVPADRGQVVVAAVSFAQAGDSIAAVARALLIFMPLLFGLLVLITWLVTGYTLRPIAELRRGAAEVTQTGIPRDLPVPPARDEVRSLALTLNDMLSRLAEAQQRQRDLVSDTAHELRSPIASIRAQLEVAIDHPDGLDWAETARDVHADTLRLARLAEDLLLLARLDEQRIRRSPVDLAEVCTSVAARYTAARVPVAADAPAPVMVSGDPDALQPAGGEPARQRRPARGHPGQRVGAGVRRSGQAGGHRRRPRHPRRGPRTGVRPVLEAGRRAEPGGRGRGGGDGAGRAAWTGLGWTGLGWTGLGWGWPSCGPPPRRTAARSRWGTPARACALPSGCRAWIRWDQPPGRQRSHALDVHDDRGRGLRAGFHPRRHSRRAVVARRGDRTPAAGPAGPRRRPAQEGAGHGGPRSPVRDQLRFRGGGHRHARVRRPAEN